MPGSVGNWTWETRPLARRRTFLHPSPGFHRVEFSGRSNGFKMDRVHIYPLSVGGTAPTSGVPALRHLHRTTVANSTGVVSTLEAIGSPIASRNDLTLPAWTSP